MARSRRAGKRLRWLCPADRERVVERLRAGDRVLDVAAAFDVSGRTVERVRERAALVGRRALDSGFRLSYAERVQIEVRLGLGQSVRVVARAIGRAPSTVSREVARNGGREGYRPVRAERRAQRCARRERPGKLAGCPRLLVEVEKGLRECWSPEQISSRLRVDHPDDEEMRISHETIYRSLYVQSRGELRRQLTAQLRTGRRTRRLRGGSGSRGQIVGMVPIAERPPEVDERRVPGHWEGDLLLGTRGGSAIVTLVERHTRYVLLAHLGSDRTTEHVIDALAQRIRGLPAHLVKSLTWDQGRELAAHARFTSETRIQVYFCDPRSPWQRGSNENTNGLLRQYLPKGSDLAVHDQQALDRIAAELNGRPRKTLGWLKPAEKMAELLGEEGVLPTG
jgi:transposase, IS30 family